jgi:pectinesterase
VSKSGGGGQYTTIQAAVNALSTTSTAAQCIFIYPGVYTEQVLVPARQAQLSVYGSTADTSSYAANRVTITGSKSQADGLTNDETATLRVKAAGFRLYNVNVANTYGKGSQAVAVSAQAESGYYGCALTGYRTSWVSDLKWYWSEKKTDALYRGHAASKHRGPGVFEVSDSGRNRLYLWPGCPCVV